MIITSEELEHYELTSAETFYIYFLYYKEELVYIGQTQNIYSRILSHKKDKLFDNVKIKRFDNITKEKIFNIERKNINHYSPIFNDSLRVFKTPEFAFVKGLGKFETKKFYKIGVCDYYYDGNILHSTTNNGCYIEILKDLIVQEEIEFDNANIKIVFDDTNKAFTIVNILKM